MPDTTTLGREDVLRKIRALLMRANHSGTPQAEAESALALAYRLMVKYDLDERAIDAKNQNSPRLSDDVISRTYTTTGPYRVRRNALRYAIATVLSCASCRDFDEGDNDNVVAIYFGTEADLDALEILYAAAEMLALRTIPQGDRSFRTSWFHGFTKGVQDKLLAERNKIARSKTGMEVVLRDRMDRANDAMHIAIPGITSGRTSTISWGDAYTEGVRAGSSFTAGGRGVSGSRGALPRGN